MATCRTCLAQLQLPINLFDLNYKPLLNVLQLLLTFQVYVPEQEFNICCHCHEKLKGIFEFQKNCMQAVDCTTDYETVIKTESSVINPSYSDHDYQSKSVVATKELSLTVEKSVARQKVLVVEERESSVQDSGDDLPYNPAGEDDNSDSDYHCTESSKKRKRYIRVTRSKPSIDRNLESKSDGSDVEQTKVLGSTEDNLQPSKKRGAVKEKIGPSAKGRKFRVLQFSIDEVQKALIECDDSISYEVPAECTTCVICKFPGKLRRSLSRHMKTFHKIELATWCRFCNILTDNLQQHENQTKCNEIRCTFCNIKFLNVSSLKHHIKKHCRNEEFNRLMNDRFELIDGQELKLKQYPVDDVYKAVIDCNDAVNYAISVEKLTCLICNFQAKVRRALTRHMLHTHKDTVSNWCRFCNILTDNLSQHDKTVKCNEQRCRFCNMIFSNIYSLKQHLRKHCDSKELDHFTELRANEARLMLDELNQLPKEQVLQAITECIAHTKELKYISCLYCNYVAVRTRFLSAHMGCYHSNHSKTWCGRCNLQTTDLKQHVDSTKCNEYPCVFCRVAKFKNAYELVSHLRLHCSELTNDERPDNNDDFQPDEKDIVPSVSESVTPTNTSTTTVKSDLEMYLLGTSENEDLSNVDNNTVIPDVGTGEIIGDNNWVVKRFPKEVVVQAITELSNFTNDPKFKQCVLCRKHYTDTSYLRGHMKIRHKDQLLKWCINCNLITDDLKDHRISTKCNIKKCTLCYKNYPSYRCVRRHLNSHFEFDGSFEGRPEKTVCPICGKHYRNIGAHIYSNHNVDKKMEKVQCLQCGKIFKSLNTLKAHINRHSKQKTIPCLVCGKNFYIQSEMKLHMEVHEGGPVQCKVCDKVLNRPGVLKLHMRQHTGENKHVCEHCGKSFHKKTLLNDHRVCHSEERPYKCNFCDKRFKIIPTLRHHEQTHEGLRPYKCTFCSFKAVQSHALTIHMKMHPEDAPQANNPHKCSFCHRSFSTNAVLQSHTDYIHGDNGNNRKKSYKKINPDDDDDNN